jgi:5S rRNA maturation endonuclease (ribonuclease M5)
MDWEQLHEDLQRVLEDLAEKNRRAPIIVEGEYDKRSLRALGVTGDIRMINQGSTVFGLCELIAAHHREAIILTDWDVRGGRLLCRKDITDVESLHGFVERVAEQASSGSHQRPSKRWYSERVQRRDSRRRS